MDKSLLSSSSSPAAASTPSTKTKRSFYRRKPQYQERIMEQSASSLQTTAISMPSYLTTNIIRQTPSSKTASADFGDLKIEQVERKITDK